MPYKCCSIRMKGILNSTEIAFDIDKTNTLISEIVEKFLLMKPLLYLSSTWSKQESMKGGSLFHFKPMD